MNREEYMDEIQLIQDQNDTEFEIYPLVSEIISPTLKELSKRYVFARRRSPLGHIYYGISSFPDIAILDRNFRNKECKVVEEENWNKLKGCVEVKAYNKPLYNLKELKDYIYSSKCEKQLNEVAQLIGEIIWYKKVLYTNGVQWKLFTFKSYSNYKDIIIESVNKRINNSLQKDWWNKPAISNIINKEILEETIIDDCINNWVEFIRNIEKINWKE